MTALDPGFRAVDSVFQVHNSRYFVTATWLPDSKAQDSRFQIPDSTTTNFLDSGFPKKNLLGFLIIRITIKGATNSTL